MATKMDEVNNRYCYLYEGSLAHDEYIIIDIPPVAPNKRPFEIAYQTDLGTENAEKVQVLYSLVSGELGPLLWTEASNGVINRAAARVKILNHEDTLHDFAVRVVMI